MENNVKTRHPYVGIWATQNGFIRQEILPDGRYDETRGAYESVHTGRYMIDDGHIEYIADTGVRASGDFEGNVLYYAGHIFYRQTDELEIIN